MGEKPDPKDFILQNLSGQEIVRNPGQIRGYDFAIDNLTGCTVYLLDHSAQIMVDDCTDCTFYIGPVEGSAFFRDCSNCKISISVAQFRAKNVKDTDVYVFSNSDPSIEYCSGLRFAPLNLSYPRQDEHFRAAKLSLDVDHWSQVFDFNLAAGEELHWKILPADEFTEQIKAVEGEGTPVNPVDRHVTYGGSLTEEIQVGAQSQSSQLGEIQQFGFDVTQEQAEAMVEQGYAPMVEDQQDPFAAPAASDPFAAPAASDPFAAPGANDPFVEQPAADPFAAPPAADPFAAPPAADPFATGTTAAPVESSFLSEQDEEELERQRLRDAEHQERMSALYQREEAERTEKDSRRDAAKIALQDWTAQRAKAIETRKKINTDQEAVNREAKAQGANEKSWQRVVNMIDFKAQTESKDRTRLRNVLMAKKSEG